MLRILLVDDEPIILDGIRMIITDRLKREDEVWCAQNALAALELCRDHTFDLVITDIRMPVMNGFELVNELRKRSINCDMVVLTSHADFSYAQKALREDFEDFLLKPVNEEALNFMLEKMEMKLQNKKQLLRQQLIKDLRAFVLYDQSYEEADFDLKEAKELFSKRYLTVFLAQGIDHNDSLSFEEVLRSRYSIVIEFSFPQRHQHVYLVNHAELITARETQNLLKELRSNTGVVSYTSDNILELPWQYRDANRKQNYRSYFSGEEASKAMPLSRFAVQNLLNDVSPFVRKQKLRGIVDQVLSQLGALGDEAYQVAYEQIMAGVQDDLQSVGLDVAQRERSMQLSLHSREQLEQLLTECITRSNGSIRREFGSGKPDKMINRVLQYIDEHYQEDLSLDMLAERFGMHPNYLSSLFRKKQGVSFITYMHRKRIDVACTLLRDTKVSVEEVSKQTGYASPNYFITIFKKYVGMTPGEYRHSLL